MIHTILPESEEIDDEGRLYISIAGVGNLSGVGRVKNRSILRLTTTRLGSESAGTWEHLVDGRDIGLNLSSENIDGLDLVPAADGAEISFLISWPKTDPLPNRQREIPGSRV